MCYTKNMLVKHLKIKISRSPYPTRTLMMRGFGSRSDHFGTNYVYYGRRWSYEIYVPKWRFFNKPALLTTCLLVFALVGVFVTINHINTLKAYKTASSELIEAQKQVINELTEQIEWVQRSNEAEFWTPERVKEEIVKSATLHGVDPQKALAIAECESHFKPMAKNPSSSAVGIYQWLFSSWEYIGSPGNRLDVRDNVNAFMVHYPKNPKWWEECNK